MKKFDVPVNYRSSFISEIKKSRREKDKLKKDFSPTFLDFGKLHIYLARHFGFCYGVEHAIEIAFKTVGENPGKRIFLLSEMIHNPNVNDDLLKKGVRFLMDTKGNTIIPFDDLKKGDIVVTPAFGTTIEIEEKLKKAGVELEQYNTTCPFVEKVWNRAQSISKSNYSIVIHGKPQHEETRATFSKISTHTPTVIVRDMAQATELASYISGTRDPETFYAQFAGQYSEGFKVERDLQRIGVVNQTTMLAADTQSIADFFKKTMIEKYNLNESTITERFADTRDTLCYATTENQGAVYEMLEKKADFAIVIGGYNSSNTSHLVELCEHKLATYFITSADEMISNKEIRHYNLEKKNEVTTLSYLPEKKPVTVLITSGASCPDSLVEEVILKLAVFYGETLHNKNDYE
ncbi:MAG: 4-hydroxy-3-methylbut-2-enyl diphosphate reductase [Ginsengibacter sp.]|jgi:4-hydroxy-3-methylbut-2-enyl diphosphate reductase